MMVKKRGIVWNYFEKKVDGTQVIAFCKFCDQSYTQNATRMEKHLERCPKCPDDIRLQFMQVGATKRSKARLLGDTMDAWVKQDGSIEDEGSTSAPQTVELIMQGDQSWVGRETELESAEHEETVTKTEWIASQSNTESADALIIVHQTANNSENRSLAAPQEQAPRSVPRKIYYPRRVSQWPLITQRAAPSHSPLQSKIYQEQLLEKRALRRVAELELRRKTLEFERFQWEYERDKAQSDLKWAHENRMMQLKEERERQLIEQGRARLCTTMSNS
ncbi:uncharacterized protein LOC117179430 isoform X3 [Belonocnema kinseyi]|uniref:uncharacterized protein LOC117179430 isoform X3 n=1 Tax=Belonocnema kinseyi TaxID=2817044 RepID=UPI00143D7DA8|nr:uncharacterized protein LOC117179430 isoform X3 [Belonocnema kinseyi]